MRTFDDLYPQKWESRIYNFRLTHRHRFTARRVFPPTEAITIIHVFTSWCHFSIILDFLLVEFRRFRNIGDDAFCCLKKPRDGTTDATVYGDAMLHLKKIHLRTYTRKHMLKDSSPTKEKIRCMFLIIWTRSFHQVCDIGSTSSVTNNGSNGNWGNLGKFAFANGEDK